MPVTASHAAAAPVLGRLLGGRPLWQAGLAAALVAAAANAALYLAARAAGVPLELTEVFSDEFERMPLHSFVLATLLEGGAAGTVLAAACRRWARRPRASFVALAVTGTVASLCLPVASDGSIATIVVLSVSHVVAALVIVPALALALVPNRTG
jgi:hypothetical protein